jgi:DNA helicase-2/ATP-dependent DNA helicase PcrA
MPLKLIKQDGKTKKYKILDGLNEAQREAVTTIRGPVLIVAGAGSGKTRVLTHRIAFLIEQGISPGNIIALTFTNKAAAEMRERIATLVPEEAASKIWAGTFHSVFARILRDNATLIGYTNAYTIYDTDDSQNLVKHILNDMGIREKKFSPQLVRNRISWAKNRMLTWEQLHNDSRYSDDKTIADIYKEYEDALKRSNAMDFDDLLINMIRLLTQHPDVLEEYQNKFQYIHVDEYQDTNRPQYMVCKLLAGKNSNICVVGDDAQSIYKWRGAEIRNILEFQKDFKNVRVVRLERNYRSTKTILAAADSVIKYNKKQIPKELWTENVKGDKIKLVECGDDLDEADYIIKRIKKLIDEEDFDAKDCAVLYRTNAQSLAFENACRKYNLPYIIVGGMSFYKRKEVKDTLAYLKFINNLRDSESLLRIINEPPRGIGNTTLNHFRNFAAEQKISLYEAFKKSDEVPDLQTRARNATKAFVDMIENMLATKDNLSPQDFALKYIEATGLMQMYSDIGTDDALDRWNNIQQVLADISQYFRDNPETDLVDYLQQISLISEIDEKDINTSRVKLMTLHSAKGLEFPVVFIAGVEKGLFPFARAENIPEEEEEERRLFYVGITRAMEKLTITYAKRRMRFGDYSFQSPSKFISEIDDNLLEFESSRTSVFQKQKQKSTTYSYGGYNQYNQIPPEENYSQIQDKSPKFKVGDKVRHSHFGIGQIVMLAGEGEKRQATVNFQTVGRKKLMLQYAKLQKI